MDEAAGSLLEGISLLNVGKHVREPDLSYLCSPEEMEAKKAYWKENIGSIKKVVGLFPLFL